MCQKCSKTVIAFERSSRNPNPFRVFITALSSNYRPKFIEIGVGHPGRFPRESDLSSIITHTNHIGLRQHLSSNNKILLNDDADLIAETYGLYNVNDYTKEHERNIILCGYDG